LTGGIGKIGIWDINNSTCKTEILAPKEEKQKLQNHYKFKEIISMNNKTGAVSISDFGYLFFWDLNNNLLTKYIKEGKCFSIAKYTETKFITGEHNIIYFWDYTTKQQYLYFNHVQGSGPIYSLKFITADLIISGHHCSLSNETTINICSIKENKVITDIREKSDSDFYNIIVHKDMIAYSCSDLNKITKISLSSYFTNYTK